MNEEIRSKINITKRLGVKGRRQGRGTSKQDLQDSRKMHDLLFEAVGK